MDDQRILDSNSDKKELGYTLQEEAEWVVDLNLQIDKQGGHDIPLQQDPCTIASRFTGPISYDVVKACLDTDFEFPKDLRHNTVATIKNLISNFYVFEDLAASPPNINGLTFRPVELIKEIEQLLEQSRAVSLVNGEIDNNNDEQGDESDRMDDFQESTSQASMTHREFHDSISRILSKARDGHLSYDADCFRVFRFQHGFFMNHVVRDGKAVVKVHSVTPYFQSLHGLEYDIFNCDVAAIAGKDAVEYLQEWADTHVSMSKDANVRFNAVLATPQYRSGTLDFFIPGKFSERFMLPEEKSLELAFRCPGLSSEDTLKVDVKWVGFYSHDRTRPFKDTPSYYEANCIKSDEETSGNEDDRSRLEREQDSEQRNVVGLKSALRELLSGPTAISFEQLPVVKFYDDYGGRTGGMNTASSDPLFAELYRGQHGINPLLLNDGKTGVITVRTESSTIRNLPYSQVHPAWAGSLIQAINILRPRAEHLILDLSHNTGGYVCLGLTMIQLFFPERPRLVTSVRLSELGTKLMKTGAMGMDHFIRSKFAVKTVVIGGRSTSTQEPMSYSTFPGLQVIDDMYILNEIHDARRQVVSEQAPEQETWEEREPVVVNGGQDDFSVENMDAKGKDDGENVDEEDDEDEDENDEGEDDVDSLYPKSFAHKSRLRLTWRQIYHTGGGIGMFWYSPASDEYEPLWKEVDRWHGYSFIPASHRLDYTDHNVHSMGTIWMDTRDVVWGD
ncbi:MAG: hypothetical protein J3Q66DRAFT_412237 [Benniella sp.]|nr:MAG: hypothetical protein J3Q66DRAFT_412237 [Benniella sp.]